MEKTWCARDAHAIGAGVPHAHHLFDETPLRAWPPWRGVLAVARRKVKTPAHAAGMDWISDLPDEILHRIMSFLNARQAVQTCVLSRRWRNLWRTVPCINADCKEFDFFGFRRSEVEFKSLTLGHWCLHGNFYTLIVFLQNSPRLEKLTLILGNDHWKTFEASIGDKLDERSFTCEHIMSVKVRCSEDDPMVSGVVNFFVNSGMSSAQIHIKNWS
ncbi:hypothetical protein OsI_32628 [Oryza sativa Indica Group]|uniref:F-box domain-containing protein n=1 Tax=Oryza sativa subsp. indica TaxID=39946 RepID=B8BFF4_ORYSI|nr:hypothetical protein OsI_32628 [Oryza sativa Indica Group]